VRPSNTRRAAWNGNFAFWGRFFAGCFLRRGPNLVRAECVPDILLHDDRPSSPLNHRGQNNYAPSGLMWRLTCPGDERAKALGNVSGREKYLTAALKAAPACCSAGRSPGSMAAHTHGMRAPRRPNDFRPRTGRGPAAGFLREPLLGLDLGRLDKFFADIPRVSFPIAQICPR
jgi:hypothetical protein